MYKNFISFKILSSDIGKAPHQYFIVKFFGGKHGEQNKRFLSIRLTGEMYFLHSQHPPR